MNACVLIADHFVPCLIEVSPVAVTVPADRHIIHKAMRLLAQIDDVDIARCLGTQNRQHCMERGNGELCTSGDREAVESCTRGNIARIDTNLLLIVHLFERGIRRAEITRERLCIPGRSIDSPEITAVVGCLRRRCRHISTAGNHACFRCALVVVAAPAEAARQLRRICAIHLERQDGRSGDGGRRRGFLSRHSPALHNEEREQDC